MVAEISPVRWAGQHAVVVTLPAEIDAVSNGQVRAVLEQALAADAAVLVADMTATCFCASEGIRMLLQAHRAAAAAGSQLRVAAPGPHVRRVMDLTGVARVLDIYPSLQAALDGGPA